MQSFTFRSSPTTPCSARCFSDNESVIECHITDDCDAAKWTMQKQQGDGIRKNVQENCHNRRKSCSSGLQRSQRSWRRAIRIPELLTNKYILTFKQRKRIAKA
ncbi:hypothetical protein M5D96_005096 [Drosophila gunungcola]|uniref:Uncharacterized protein n=1 Tax=Drosophila gunungcola TaxID=103775 RepID=A0A9P9YVA0_9MUSC|nr:hypothetical protein M5D96_005096 [Drosophila gunungcola]